MEPNEVTEQVVAEQAEPVAVAKTEGRMKTMKRGLLVLVPVFLLFVVGTALALPPRITWNPNPLVTEGIAPGEEATYTVVLTNTGYLPILLTKQLRVLPEGAIAPYVTVTPPTFPSVFKRGQSVNVVVKVAVPADAPVGVSEGKLLLKRVIGSRVLDVWRAEALPVEFTFSTIPLPPDPGEAGKATIEGIDADGDGVRDDVQRWIGFSFPDQPAVRAGLRQYAIALQQALIDADSEELALIHSEQNARASRCLKAMVGLDEGYAYHTSLKVEMLNTNDRSLAYIQYDRQLGGHVFHVPDVSLDMCDFDPAKI